MAKDDYFVIVYRILAYLYACLKEDNMVNLEYLEPHTKPFPIGDSYWEYIWRNLSEEGYVSGVMLVPILSEGPKMVKIMPDVQITPKGIEFIQENTSIQRAKEFLKTLKEIIPGL